MWLFQRADKNRSASNDNTAGVTNDHIVADAQTENVSEIQINNNNVNTNNRIDKDVRSNLTHDPNCSTFTSSSSHSCFCIFPSHELQMDNKDDKYDKNTMVMTHKPLLRPIKDIANASENDKDNSKNRNIVTNDNNNNINEAKEKNAYNNSNSISNTITRITSTSSLPCSLPLHTSSTESQSYSPIVFPDTTTPAHSHRMESSDYSIQPSLQFPPSATCFSEWTVMTSTEDVSQPVSLSTGGPIQAHFHARHGFEHTDDHITTNNNNNNNEESNSSNGSNSTNDSSMSSIMHHNNNIITTNQYMVRAFSSNKESVEGSEIPNMTPSNDKSSCNAVCGSISDVNQNNNNGGNGYCYYLPKLDLMSLFHSGGNRGKTSTLHKAERAVNKSSAMMEEWINNTTSAHNNNNNNNNVMSTTSSSLNDTDSYHILVHDSMYTSNENNHNNNNENSISRTNISSPQTFIVSTGNSAVNTNILHPNTTPVQATSLPGQSPRLPDDHPLSQYTHVLSYNSWNTISERTPTKTNNVCNCNGFLRRIVHTSSLSSSSLSASSFSHGLPSPNPASHDNEPHPEDKTHGLLSNKKNYYYLHNVEEMKAAIRSHIRTHCMGVNGCLQSASAYCYNWWCYAHLARFKLHHMHVEGIPSASEQLDQAIINSLVKSSSMISQCVTRMWDVVREDVANHWYPQIMLVLGDEEISYKGEFRPHNKCNSSCEDPKNTNTTDGNDENANSKEKSRSKANLDDLYELSWLWSLTSGSIISTLQNILVSLP